jgi:hypothetical protein
MDLAIACLMAETRPSFDSLSGGLDSATSAAEETGALAPVSMGSPIGVGGDNDCGGGEDASFVEAT